MAKGERSQLLQNTRSKIYYKKRGFKKRATGWFADVSHKAGTNKYTKRLTNKSIRREIKHLIRIGDEL